MTEYKGFNIACDGTYGMYNIKQMGRGALPAALRGSFTNPNSAMRLITNYLTAKGVTNDDKEEQRDRS